MPELRTDWLSGRAVLIAENRALRPNEFSNAKVGEAASAAGSVVETCPFCVGSEHRTPPAVCEKRGSDGNWLVRVVPNAFPAVNNLSGAPDSIDLGPRDLSSTAETIAGVHEVIIESPFHAERMSKLSSPQLREVVDAYSLRLQHWRETKQLRYGLIFKNQGPRAGASLTHVHSQLMALPFIPTAVAGELERARQQNRQSAHCSYCTLIRQEQTIGSRIVFNADGFIAFCPQVSWQPHEVWLMPTHHAPSFEAESPGTLDRLAQTLHILLARFESIVPSAQYNLLLRTAPWTDDFDESFHWRIELLPRANSLAGLEVATGVHINPLPPEQAASQLRAAKLF
ncbi:MAG TPA: DUF4931 domain-containing protein [Lacipirellulaceae bacterium]|jgi:UDPglucose--hexose-1-phosphate uridylyltransferase|nr:DUF4931 domain-containing protein [Lacipirellulaceae bacterium]